jgi:mitochondrial fission protein ELM1
MDEFDCSVLKAEPLTDGPAGRAPLNVWYMGEEQAHLGPEARSLARAISPVAQERSAPVRLGPPWLPRALDPLVLRRAPGDRRFAPPWPDVLVSSGARSERASILARRLVRDAMLTVHIHRPRRPEAFDLVVAMADDVFDGPNVIHVDAVLHEVHPSALVAAAAIGHPALCGLPRPWIGLVLGEAIRGRAFAARDAKRLADQLDAFRTRLGGSLLIIRSEGPPSDMLVTLSTRYASDPGSFLVVGPEAYLPSLAMADHLVVASDEPLRLSEALATTANIWVYEVAASRAHARFVDHLLNKRLVARFGERAPPPRRVGVDPALAVSQRIRQLASTRARAA